MGGVYVVIGNPKILVAGNPKILVAGNPKILGAGNPGEGGSSSVLGGATSPLPTSSTDTTFMRLLTHEKTLPQRNYFANISPTLSTS